MSFATTDGLPNHSMQRTALRATADPFVTFFTRVTLTPEETAQHEKLKATSIRVRTPMIANFEFLRDLGLAGEPANTDLQHSARLVPACETMASTFPAAAIWPFSYEHDEYDRLWMVLGTLNELL